MGRWRCGRKTQNNTDKINILHRKNERTTAVTRDLGFRLNLKMVLYLENLCLTEKPRIFNPKPRVAPERYARLQTVRRTKIMKNTFRLLFLMILLSSCSESNSKKSAQLESTKSVNNDLIIDTIITLSEKYNYLKLNQTFSEKEAENTLYEYFKKKKILPQSFVKGDMSENEEQLFVDFDTIYRFPSDKSIAIITYWLAPAYLNGHCVQPKRAFISRSNKKLIITNEEFIPERFLIDSINKSSIMFISDYDCSNNKVTKKYRLKIK